MPATSPASPGLIDSILTLGRHLIATVQDQVELFSLELHEERLRLVQMFVWVCAALFAGIMAVIMASVGLVYFFWESARFAVLVGLTVFYGGVCAALILSFRNFLARQPRPFAASLQQLERDRSCFREQN